MSVEGAVAVSDKTFATLNTVAIFCTNINMRAINPSFYDSIHHDQQLQSERDSASEETGSIQSSTSMKEFYKNMSGCPLFEETIASLVKLEVEAMVQKNDLQDLERSASFKFISKLITVIQNTPAAEETLPKMVSYTTSLVRILMQA